MAVQALQQQIASLALQAKAMDPETMSKSEKNSILVTIDNFRQSVDIESKNNDQAKGSVRVNVLILNSSSGDQISQLPIEVITIIFNVVIGKTGVSSQKELQKILSLETVCKQWQTIKTIPIFNYLKNDQILAGLSYSLNKLALPFQTLQEQISMLFDQAGKMDPQAISESKRTSFSKTIYKVLAAIYKLPENGLVTPIAVAELRNTLLTLSSPYIRRPVSVKLGENSMRIEADKNTTVKDLKVAASAAFDIPVESINRLIFPPEVNTIFPDDTKVKSIWKPGEHRIAHLLKEA